MILEGDDYFLPGGNGGLVHALTKNVPSIFEKIIHATSYNRNSLKVINGGQLFEGDVTFPHFLLEF